MIDKDTKIRILPLFALLDGENLRHRPCTLRMEQSFAIISIMTSPFQPVHIPKNENCLGELRVNFPDLINTIEGFERHELFSPEIANKIWAFLETVPQAKTLIIHCEAGVSRSPAVGAAIAQVLGQDYEEYFTKFVPNPLVYRIMLETWNKNHGIKEPVVVPPQKHPDGYDENLYF